MIPRVVRAALRVVFAYRRHWEQSRALVAALTEEVIKGLTVEERAAVHAGVQDGRIRPGPF